MAYDLLVIKVFLSIPNQEVIAKDGNFSFRVACNIILCSLFMRKLTK
jgi:hypothetical protein